MNNHSLRNIANHLGRITNGKRAVPFALLILALHVSLTVSAAAQAPFTDNFEAPTINPFWTIVDHAGSGSVNLDTTYAHSGKQSVQVNTDSYGGVEALSHSFPSPLYGSVYVWVYYSNTTGTGYKQLDIFDGPGFSGSDYRLYIDWGDLQTYVKDSSGATTLLAPAQSTGWHRWTFASVSGEVTIRIDDNKVFSQPVAFAFETVNLQQCCLAGSAFFDDFRFTPADCDATGLGLFEWFKHKNSDKEIGDIFAVEVLPKKCDLDNQLVKETVNYNKAESNCFSTKKKIPPYHKKGTIFRKNSRAGEINVYFDLLGVPPGLPITSTCSLVFDQEIDWIASPPQPPVFLPPMHKIYRNFTVTGSSTTIQECLANVGQKPVCAPPQPYQ